MKQRVYSILLSFCLLALFSASGLSADIDSIEVRVLPESIVYNEYYNLGDIAELDGFDIETIQALAKLQIGKSPLPGRSYRVSQGILQRKIEQFTTDRKIKIVMSSKPIVSRASVKIDDQQIRQLVIKEINTYYSNYDQVEIEIRTKLKDVYLPKGQISYEVSRIGKSIKIGGISTWKFKLLVDGVEFKKLFVRAKISVFDDVVVAKSRIPRGEKIQKADVRTIKKNISKEHVGYKSEPRLLVGQKAQRDIGKNETVKKQYVDDPILIKKGSPIKLVYKTKNLLLTNIVKALKSGKKGDVIPVRPLQGDRTIYAIVMDENSVKVAL